MGEVARALRRMSANAGLTAVVMLSLALGGGVATAGAALFYKGALAPLPFQDATRLVSLIEYDRLGRTSDRVAIPTFLDWRTRASAFASMAILVRGEPRAGTTSATDDAAVTVAFVSTGFFDTLAERPAIGRAFSSGEERLHEPADVCVLSHGYWRRQFGGRHDIVGQSLAVGGRSLQIVGVSGPRVAAWQPDVDVWLPLGQLPLAFDERVSRERLYGIAQPIARLKPGISLAKADEELRRVSLEVGEEHPELGTPTPARVVRLQDAWVDARERRAVITAAGVAAAVWAIAIVNALVVLGASALGRRREFAVRRALGADRRHLLTQCAIETAMYALGAAGIAACVGSALPLLGRYVGLPLPGLPSLIGGLLPSEVARADLPPRVWLGAAVAVAALSAMIVASVVFLFVGRTGLAGTARAAFRWPLRSLVAIETGAAALVAGAALILSVSFVNLVHRDLGIVSAHVSAIEIRLPAERAAVSAAIVRDLGVTLTAARWASDAAIGSDLPTTPLAGTTSVEIVGVGRFLNSGQRQTPSVHIVTHRYLPVLGATMVEGRGFRADDTSRVAIVNEAMAREYWLGRSPLGARVILGPRTAEAREVVGVVADIVYGSPRLPSRPHVYVLPSSPMPPRGYLLIASRGPFDEVRTLAASAIRRVAPDVKLVSAAPLDTMVRALTADARGMAAHTALLSVLAWLLACVGVAVVTTYVVTQRRGDLAVRLALGADPTRLVRHLVADMSAAGIGAACVAAVACWLWFDARADLTFGLSAWSRAGWVALALAPLVSSAAIASLVPARRILRTDLTRIMKMSERDS